MTVKSESTYCDVHGRMEVMIFEIDPVSTWQWIVGQDLMGDGYLVVSADWGGAAVLCPKNWTF